MLFDPKLAKKLEAIVLRYTPLCFESVRTVPVEWAETKEHFRNVPERAGLRWWRARPFRPFEIKTLWVTPADVRVAESGL